MTEMTEVAMRWHLFGTVLEFFFFFCLRIKREKQQQKKRRKEQEGSG